MASKETFLKDVLKDEAVHVPAERQPLEGQDRRGDVQHGPHGGDIRPRALLQLLAGRGSRAQVRAGGDDDPRPATPVMG
jgi:hypothetical protein